MFGGRRLPRRPRRHPAVDRGRLRPGGRRAAPGLGVPHRRRRLPAHRRACSPWSARRPSSKVGPPERTIRTSKETASLPQDSRGRPMRGHRPPDQRARRLGRPGPRAVGAPHGRRQRRPLPRRGAGDGPLVLLLHGFPQFWWAWRHQLAGARRGRLPRGRDGPARLRRAATSPRAATTRAPWPRTSPASSARSASGTPSSSATAWAASSRGRRPWSSPRQVRRLVAVSMPHPRRLRSALLTDARQVRASRHVLGFQRPVAARAAAASPTTAPQVGRPAADLVRARAGPTRTTEARYRQAVQIPGVAHCALESYRWAVRSIPRPDGLRFARRMSRPGHGADAAAARRPRPGRAAGQRAGLRPLRRGAVPLAADARASGTSRPRRTRRRSPRCCATGWPTPSRSR